MITLKDPRILSITSPEEREHYYDPIIFWQEYGDDIPEPKKQPTEEETAEYIKFRKTRNESKEWDELGGWDRYEVLRRRYDWRDIVTGKEGYQGLKSPDGRILLPEIFFKVLRQSMSILHKRDVLVPVSNGDGFGICLLEDKPIMLTDFMYADIITDREGQDVYFVQSKETGKWGALAYYHRLANTVNLTKENLRNWFMVLRELLPCDYDEIYEDQIYDACVTYTFWVIRKGDKIGIMTPWHYSEIIYDGYDTNDEDGSFLLYKDGIATKFPYSPLCGPNLP